MQFSAYKRKQEPKLIAPEDRLIHTVTTVLTTEEFKWLEKRANSTRSSKSKVTREAIMKLMSEEEV